MHNRIFSTLAAVIMIILVACNPSAPAKAGDAQATTPAQVALFPLTVPEPAVARSSMSPTLPTLTPRKIPLTGTYFPSLTPRKATPTATQLPTYPPIPTAAPFLPLKAGQPITLADLHMFADGRGWAVEATGHIVHTTDGGHIWTVATPPQVLPYNEGGFFALDADTAWATPLCDEPCLKTHVPMIWHTVDGGQTWQAGQPICLKGDCGYEVDFSAQYYVPRSLQFSDAQNGWLLVVIYHLMFQNRYRMYHTSDGGASWDFVIDNYQGPNVFLANGLAFTDERTGWFGISQVDGAEDPHPNWYVYKTIDGGHTWDRFDLPVPSPLPDALALNQYWCGASRVKTLDLSFYCDLVVKYPRPRYYFRFHNDGANWQAWPEPGPDVASFIDAARGWRLIADPGADGLYDLEQTHDGGLHWAFVKSVEWSGSLDFVNAQIGWAIAKNGDATALVHTLDGGKTWAEIKPFISKP